MDFLNERAVAIALLFPLKIWMNDKNPVPLHQFRGRDLPKQSIGEMVEWSITTVLKTVVLRGTGGSNPSLSAERAGQKWSANGQKATNQ